MYKIIISTLLLTSITLAEKSYTFVGAQTAFVHYNGLSSPSVGLKYGVQNSMWRSSLNLEHARNGQNKLTSFIFQADQGILEEHFKQSDFKPHMGFSIGYIQHQNNSTDRGLSYGVNTGITYLLNQKIDLDLSYRYIKVSKIKAVNSLNSLNLSLHYFY